MDKGDNVPTDDMENTPDSKEQGVSANNQKEEKGGNEEESVQLSHREAMAIWKEGLAEMIEVCVVSDSVGGGNVSDQFLMGWGGALSFDVLDPPMFAMYMFYWYDHRDSIFSTYRYSLLWEKNA